MSSLDTDTNGEYEDGLDCKWTIVVGVNKVVKLNISTMNIEYNPKCGWDYIEVSRSR